MTNQIILPPCPFAGTWTPGDTPLPVIVTAECDRLPGYYKLRNVEVAAPRNEIKALDPCRFGGAGPVKGGPIIPPNLVAIRHDPPELAKLDHWVLWRAIWQEQKGGKWKYNKVPINPKTLENAKSNDPTTWSSL